MNKMGRGTQFIFSFRRNRKWMGRCTQWQNTRNMTRCLDLTCGQYEKGTACVSLSWVHMFSIGSEHWLWKDFFLFWIELKLAVSASLTYKTWFKFFFFGRIWLVDVGYTGRMDYSLSLLSSFFSFLLHCVLFFFESLVPCEYMCFLWIEWKI